MRTFLSLAAVVALFFSTSGFAESVKGIGNIQGVVIKDVFVQEALTLTEGQLVDCKGAGGNLTSCALVGSSVVVKSGTDTVAFSPSKVLFSEIDGRDGEIIYLYNYVGEWKKVIGSVVVQSPVMLSFNYSSRNPERLVGSLRLKSYDLSYPVEAIRSAR